MPISEWQICRNGLSSQCSSNKKLHLSLIGVENIVWEVFLISQVRICSRNRYLPSSFKQPTYYFIQSLLPRSDRRLVWDLSIYYRYFNGHCSQEIRDIIPLLLRRIRTTRSSTHSYPFQVSLPNPRTLSHKSFIPRICSLWNVLPSSCLLSWVLQLAIVQI